MIQYLSLSAKISSMISSLLKSEDYNKLISAHDINDFIDTLSKFSRYSTLFINEKDITISNIERKLAKYLLSDYFVIFPHCQVHTKFFLQQVFKRYEIKNLKIILKAKKENYTYNETADMLYDLKKYGSDIDFKKVFETAGISDIIESLKKTEYFQVLTDANIIFQKTDSLFPFESALDYFYFQQIKNKSYTLDAMDQQSVHRIIFAQIDLLNLIWIYRGKYNYNLSSDEILSRKFNFGYNLPANIINELVSAPTVSAFCSVIEKTSYKNLLDENGKLDPDYLEGKMNRIILKQALTVKSGLTFNIGLILCYLLLTEFEVKDLISILECIKYKIPTQEIKKYLTVSLN